MQEFSKPVILSNVRFSRNMKLFSCRLYGSDASLLAQMIATTDHCKQIYFRSDLVHNRKHLFTSDVSRDMMS